MDALQAIMTTRAIRRFTTDPVSDADIETCLRAHSSKLYHLGIRGRIARTRAEEV
mgnify:CR=1 FL=1